MSAVDELDEAQGDLFAKRITRLEEVTRLLIGLRREYATVLVSERQMKSQIYLDHMDVSHGERQGIASARTVDIAVQVLQLRGQIEVLEEERNFLRFCVEWVSG